MNMTSTRLKRCNGLPDEDAAAEAAEAACKQSRMSLQVVLNINQGKTNTQTGSILCPAGKTEPAAD